MKRVLCFMLAAFGAVSLVAQDRPERMNDRDVSKLLENVRDDARRFRQTFDKAIEKSTIRRTSKEKDAKRLSQRFTQQTENMSKIFKDKKKIDASLVVVFQSARDLDRAIQDAGISGQVDADWNKVRTELDQIGREFNYTPPV